MFLDWDFRAALYTPIKNYTEDKCAQLPQKARLNLESLTSHWKLKTVPFISYTPWTSKSPKVAVF